MPSWAVTGKLGGGKTLWAVKKIRDYLVSGLPVATNIDIFPENFLAATRDETCFSLYRLPNMISRVDLDMLGVANHTNDERKNGLLVIDESGVSLNARSYNDPQRKELVEWFLHARKLGWDLMFIVQSISLIDKQIREAILEYRAVCKRMDRLNLPIFAWIGIRLRMPRFHFVIVRYGMEYNSTIADRDIFRGNDLFKAFNTKQLLVEAKQQAGVYSVLSPWHLKGRFMNKWQLVKSTAVVSVLIGILLGSVTGSFAVYAYTKKKQESEKLTQVSAAQPEPEFREALGMLQKPGSRVGTLFLPGGRRIAFTRQLSVDEFMGADRKKYKLSGISKGIIKVEPDKNAVPSALDGFMKRNKK